MTTLLELFDEVVAETKQQDLQQAWDQWLLSRHLTNINMRKVCVLFCIQHTITWEQFDKLLRVPRYPNQSATLPSRFLAAYLPKLSELLLDGASVDAVMAYLKTHKVETLHRPSDRRKSQKDYRERVKTTRVSKHARLEAELQTEARINGRPRNWHTVKSVRRKS